MKKIDCHCHIVTEEIKKSYFERTDGFAIVMEFLQKFVDAGFRCDAYNTVLSDERLFLCPAVDIHRDIAPQLERIEGMLPSGKVVGIKIYLTYQTGRADDRRLYPVYGFASKHRLTVTFHTGSCSLVLPTDNDMEGSHAAYVKNAAADFPDVNFVVAHMDDPRFDECVRIVHETENMFTDFSGAYEPGTHEGADMEWAIATFRSAIEQFPDSYKKFLYGTDFCPPINLTALEEYDYTISRIFTKEQASDVYYNNVLRAFPRIAEHLKENQNG